MLTADLSASSNFHGEQLVKGEIFLSVLIMTIRCIECHETFMLLRRFCDIFRSCKPIKIAGTTLLLMGMALIPANFAPDCG
jgi:hypothetical protein